MVLERNTQFLPLSFFEGGFVCISKDPLRTIASGDAQGLTGTAPALFAGSAADKAEMPKVTIKAVRVVFPEDFIFTAP